MWRPPPTECGITTTGFPAPRKFFTDARVRLLIAMANPFAKSKTFHKAGTLLVTPMWKLLPTPAGLGVVTTQGRTSGKLRARAMRVIRDGDRAYAVSILGERADWVRNISKNAHVTVKLGRHTYRAAARRATGDDLTSFAAAYRAIVGWYDYYDYLTYVWDIPTASRLRRQYDHLLADGTPMIFDLQPD